jgi:hypothetical protein
MQPFKIEATAHGCVGMAYNKFQNNPSIGQLHPKSTHAHPLAWANKKLTHNL